MLVTVHQSYWNHCFDSNSLQLRTRPAANPVEVSSLSGAETSLFLQVFGDHVQLLMTEVQSLESAFSVLMSLRIMLSDFLLQEAVKKQQNDYNYRI